MADSQHSRRDFLRGRAALGAAADAVAAAFDHHFGSIEPAPVRRAEARYLTLTRRAMACDFEVRLNAPIGEGQGGANTEAVLAALDEVERIEDRLTVYRDQSDLTDLNRKAAQGDAPLDDELLALLVLAERLVSDTEGAFDPTSGPLSRVWGFYQRQGSVPREEDLRAAMRRVGWRHVALDRERRTLRFNTESMELNANSFGKGYALDRAAAVLAERGVGDALLHGGRSTILASGSDSDFERGGWRIGLRDPLTPELRLAELRLSDEALSTSGQGTQFFEHEGRRLGHVIDPRTGWPAEGLFSATVVAPTAAEADALSTALCVLGVAGTAELCRRRPEVRALLVAPDEQGRAAVHAFNLRDEDWRIP